MYTIDLGYNFVSDENKVLKFDTKENAIKFANSYYKETGEFINITEGEKNMSTRYIIDTGKETVTDTKTNTTYEYSELEAMYEDVYYEAYPENWLTDEDCVYSRDCLLDHIREGMDCDLMKCIYEMVY